MVIFQYFSFTTSKCFTRVFSKKTPTKPPHIDSFTENTVRDTEIQKTMKHNDIRWKA